MRNERRGTLGRDGVSEGAGLQGPAPRGALHAVPRARRAAAGPTGSTSSCAWCSRPTCCFFYRARCIDSDNVPADGPAIIAPNHFSFLDHFFVAVYLRRKVHFMAKSQLFKRADAVHLHPRRRVPRPPRPARRGGVHDRRRDPQARGPDRHVRRGRALAQRRARAGAPGHRAAGAPVRRARSCPRRSPAPSACATGSASSSPRSPCSSASRCASSRWRSRRKEQSQAAAEIVFADVRALHSRLLKDGRRRVVKAARAARRAAQAAGRRPGPALGPGSLVVRRQALPLVHVVTGDHHGVRGARGNTAGSRAGSVGSDARPPSGRAGRSRRSCARCRPRRR